MCLTNRSDSPSLYTKERQFLLGSNVKSCKNRFTRLWECTCKQGVYFGQSGDPKDSAFYRKPTKTVVSLDNKVVKAHWSQKWGQFRTQHDKNVLFERIGPHRYRTWSRRPVLVEHGTWNETPANNQHSFGKMNWIKWGHLS